MATSTQQLTESVAEAGPSNPPPSLARAGTENADVADLPAPDTNYKEVPNTIAKQSEAKIASHIENSDELPSYSDLVKSGDVQAPDGSNNIYLSYLNVDLQLAKFCGSLAVKTFNEYQEKKIHLPLKTFVEQSLAMYKIIAVIRVTIQELKLSDDMYHYMNTGAEYLGCQMLVRYAILRKNPLMFRNEDGTTPPITLVTRNYMKLWLKLAQMLTNPDFDKLSKEAKAAKINIQNGEFHLLLFKLIDPDYSNHAGRRISRLIDKVFGTPSTKECTSGLCNLSPEAMKAIKYTCNCKESKYYKKKTEMEARRAAAAAPSYSE
ncbi:hypothetical protein ABW19_dt0205695 [Dactylella cylindrospora]|nr:hypothetical protein ABW19_dt0205695 [Dactylella cylindrospora]